MKIRNQILTAVCLLACFANTGQAQKWGTLKIRFVYDGKAPIGALIDVNKDRQFCGKWMLRDESLVVNPKNSGIKNVIVYLREKKSKKPAIHPSYDKKKKKPVLLKIDNKKCRFEPRVTFVRANQKLVLANGDPVAHNTKIDTYVNPAINPLLPPKTSMEHIFKKGEIFPAVPISCAIHPWMKGYIVVREHPYGATTDKDGNVVIKNIPTGKWEFQLWQEKAGYVKRFLKDGKLKKVKKGRLKLTIKPGMNDYGTLIVPAEEFKK